MKKLALILALLLLATPVFSAEDDITATEVKPDVVAWKIDTVKFLVYTATCEVTYRKVDSEGNGVGETTIIFQNIVDDEETEIDETSNEFTQLLNLINSENNIKNSITKAVKIKLGLN